MVKVCVYADSALCVGQMRDNPEAIERWECQVEGLRLYSSYQDAVGIDGEPIELSLLREIQNDLETKNIKPEDKDRINFVSMFSDIVWKKNDEN